MTADALHAFKNFHRLLCERFGYSHDDKDWLRDQISLIEFIAAKIPAPAEGDAAPAAFGELVRLANCCPELNLSNYGPDDVDELNGWAIEVAQEIDRLVAANAQPKGTEAELNKFAIFDKLTHDATRRTSLENVEDVLSAIAARYGRLHTQAPAPAQGPMTDAEISAETLARYGGELKRAMGFAAGVRFAEARVAASSPAVQDGKRLDYLTGHADGLAWAADLVAMDDPRTGDWLYDDRSDLAKAIRKGPELPDAIPPELLDAERKDAERWRAMRENLVSVDWRFQDTDTAVAIFMMHGTNACAGPEGADEIADAAIAAKSNVPVQPIGGE